MFNLKWPLCFGPRPRVTAIQARSVAKIHSHKQKSDRLWQLPLAGFPKVFPCFDVVCVDTNRHGVAGFYRQIIRSKRCFERLQLGPSIVKAKGWVAISPGSYIREFDREFKTIDRFVTSVL